MIQVDMTKARDIQRNRIRAQREAQLLALDVAYMRATESGDTATAADVTAQKQALRDAPASPLFEQAATTDDLKAITLDAILGAPAA